VSVVCKLGYFDTVSGSSSWLGGQDWVKETGVAVRFVDTLYRLVDSSERTVKENNEWEHIWPGQL